MKKNVKIKQFIKLLKKHCKRKAKLYDGIDRDMPPDVALRYAIEELGEVSTDISRLRFMDARYECIDVAHCAVLIFLSVYDLEDEENP